MATPRFNPKKFADSINKPMERISDEYGKAVANLIKEDWEQRINSQRGPNGEAMPKKKYPQRSRTPDKFLVDTGESTNFGIKKEGDAYVVFSPRPKILNYPNPKKGLDIWFGIPKNIIEESTSILKRILAKWL